MFSDSFLHRMEGCKKRSLSQKQGSIKPFSASFWAALISSSLMFVNVSPIVESVSIGQHQIQAHNLLNRGLMPVPFRDSVSSETRRQTDSLISFQQISEQQHSHRSGNTRLWASNDGAPETNSNINSNSKCIQEKKEPALRSQQVIPYQNLTPDPPTSDDNQLIQCDSSEMEENIDQTEDILTYFLLQTTSASHAEVAAALASVGSKRHLTSKHNHWQTNLQYLIDHHGFTGSDIVQIIQTWPDILGVQCDLTTYMENSVLELLKTPLGMRRSEIRKVVRRAPEMLIPREDGTTIADTVEALALVGLQPRHAKIALVSHPRLAVYTPSTVFYTSAFLMSKDVRCLPEKLGSLYKRAPWLLGQSVQDMQQVSRWLKQIGVQDVENVFRGNPEVLLKDINYLDNRFSFLCEEVGLNHNEASLVIQTFPLILNLSLTRGRNVLKYFQSIGLQEQEITKVLRAFPSLLTVEIENGMEEVISYLDQLGIRHPGRFVLSVPAILGYDVETELKPKMEYLKTKMGLTIFDVIRFPAYFSYPLETVIRPRTEFMALCNSPIGAVGLNLALSPGDDDFAMKIARSRPDTYQLFKRAYRRKQLALLKAAEENSKGSTDCDSDLDQSV